MYTLFECKSESGKKKLEKNNGIKLCVCECVHRIFASAECLQSMNGAVSIEHEIKIFDHQLSDNKAAIRRMNVCVCMCGVRACKRTHVSNELYERRRWQQRHNLYKRRALNTYKRARAHTKTVNLHHSGGKTGNMMMMMKFQVNYYTTIYTHIFDKSVK